MEKFPRTTVGDVSVSRLVIGTNWFLGYTHCTSAKSGSVARMVTSTGSIADIIEVFFRAGVDSIYCPHTKTCIPEAIAEAEQRTGVKAVIISTPGFTVTRRTAADGFDRGECERVLDEEAQELVDLSLDILEGKPFSAELQKTRSKATLLKNG